MKYLCNLIADRIDQYFFSNFDAMEYLWTDSAYCMYVIFWQFRARASSSTTEKDLLVLIQEKAVQYRI